MAFTDVQTYLHTQSDVLTGSFVRFGHLKPGLMLARKWLDRITQDRGPVPHNLEEDARACIDTKIKNGASQDSAAIQCYRFRT